ncbi:MAG: hypothetical protein A2Y82_03990 [Candidatus Buchananbacteria bacterium RBG_13_36_9]|uniref:Uncharacterized protein n=1 Tax=Candidatus Buchananbacteria bacterium RBG_13_36_9 TaxID=1797530 RepID=A0A1G1XRB2_9BACT|nr:MAG: hypothetical protein A2Y82_03990 [Candidatus Buchananbacteria bacterium RBG_13_36_9]
MKTVIKVIKILGLVILLVLTALLLQFSYVWIFSEVKTEIARFIIILIASGNLYCLTGIFVNLMFKVARNEKIFKAND